MRRRERGGHPAGTTYPEAAVPRGAALVAGALVALALSPAAGAHGSATGYTAVVTGIEPATAGVRVRVLDGDDRIELTVTGTQIVVIHGYEGEPYLRFTASGVYRNRKSPATYLNSARLGDTPLPAAADAQASPSWEQVGIAGRPYEWHDHRIHLMSRSDPPLVAADPGSPHHVFDWTIRGTIDGRPLSIGGGLDYAPLPERSFPWTLVSLPIVLPAVALLVLAIRRRHARSPREPSHAGSPS